MPNLNRSAQTTRSFDRILQIRLESARGFSAAFSFAQKANGEKIKAAGAQEPGWSDYARFHIIHLTVETDN